MQSARATEITALTIIKALNDNVCTLRFSSPAIHTTYKVHVTFQTRTEDQLEKSFQVVNACIELHFEIKESLVCSYMLFNYLSLTLPIYNHSKQF